MPHANTQVATTQQLAAGLPLAAMLGVSRQRRDAGNVARRQPDAKRAPAELDDVIG